jgi:hypothetical protein
MRASFLSALVIVLVLSPVVTAKANGLVPCDSRSAGFVEDLSDDSKGPSRGDVVLSYLDLPGLWIGGAYRSFVSTIGLYCAECNLDAIGVEGTSRCGRVYLPGIRCSPIRAVRLDSRKRPVAMSGQAAFSAARLVSRF